VDLPAVVVATPSPPSFRPVSGSPTFPRTFPLHRTGEFQDGIWGDTHTLLFEYSSLSERRRDLDLVRTGTQ
jgi:hypothetical protein